MQAKFTKIYMFCLLRKGGYDFFKLRYGQDVQ